MGVGAAQEGVADRSVGSVVAAVGLSRRCWSPRKRRQKQQRSCVLCVAARWALGTACRSAPQGAVLNEGRFDRAWFLLG